jgi:hypothetical protein
MVLPVHYSRHAKSALRGPSNTPILTGACPPPFSGPERGPKRQVSGQISSDKSHKNPETASFQKQGHTILRIRHKISSGMGNRGLKWPLLDPALPGGGYDGRIMAPPDRRPDPTTTRCPTEALIGPPYSAISC